MPGVKPVYVLGIVISLQPPVEFPLTVQLLVLKSSIKVLVVVKLEAPVKLTVIVTTVLYEGTWNLNHTLLLFPQGLPVGPVDGALNKVSGVGVQVLPTGSKMAVAQVPFAGCASDISCEKRAHINKSAILLVRFFIII